MKILEQKQELVDWLSKVTDEKTLLEIKSIQHRADFNFKEGFAKGITSDKLKAETTKFLKSLPWKK